MIRALRTIACLPLALTLCLGCSDSAPKPNELATDEKVDAQDLTDHGIKFKNVATDWQLTHSFSNDVRESQPTMLETLGGGAGLLDFDGDGFLDVFLAGGGAIGDRTVSGASCALFRQSGGDVFEDATLAARVHQSQFFTQGVAAADFDNDGFTDVLVTGWKGLYLFHNQGDGTFIESSQSAELQPLPWSNSAAWGDINADGCLDLYIAQYVDWSFDNNPECRDAKENRPEICSPRDFTGLPDHFYLSNGDGTFRDVSGEWKIPKDGTGLGVIMADVDVDGDTDIYVANDSTRNFLLRNDSNEKLVDVGLDSGSGLNGRGGATGSMGVDVSDIDDDSLPDVWVTNYENEASVLYRNLGGTAFRDTSRVLGLDLATGPTVGWGTVIADLDMDGDRDIFVTNGHPNRYPVNLSRSQLPHVLLNGNGRFVDVAKTAGQYSEREHSGRGVAVGDIDNDGDSDILVTHIGEPIAFLQNQNEPKRSWLRLRLVGTTSNRDAVGAVVQISSENQKQTMLINGGGSFLSTHDMRLLVSLPTNAAGAKIQIRWPSGIVQTMDVKSVNRDIRALEQDN